jgi:hypothetical protein
VLAVYTGACGSWTQLICSANSGAYCGSGNNADINFNGSAGTDYYILAGGFNGQGGQYLRILIPVVDLVSANLTATNLAIAGRAFSASWTVANQGASAINGTWTDRLMVSNSTSQVVLSNFTRLRNATAGRIYTNSFSGPFPAIAPTNYTLIAVANANQDVVETNENNNAQTLSLAVTNLRPTITLFTPTNSAQRISCAPVIIVLSASAQLGSYVITNVEFYDASLLVGSVTNGSPQTYSTRSSPLDHGAHTITAQAVDAFGFRSASSNSATVSILWPTQTNVLRDDILSNQCYVCMTALNGSNYVVQITTNLQNSNSWLPYATNQAVNSILVATNQMSVPWRFFRTRLAP